MIVKDVFSALLIGAGIIAIRHADHLDFLADVAVTALGLLAITLGVIFSRDDAEAVK